MPIYAYKCPNCPEYIEIFRSLKEYETAISCQKCQTDMDRQLNLIGGYHIKGNNSASQRPKQAGSFRRKGN